MMTIRASIAYGPPASAPQLVGRAPDKATKIKTKTKTKRKAGLPTSPVLQSSTGNSMSDRLRLHLIQRLSSKGYRTPVRGLQDGTIQSVDLSTTMFVPPGRSRCVAGLQVWRKRRFVMVKVRLRLGNLENRRKQVTILGSSALPWQFTVG